MQIGERQFTDGTTLPVYRSDDGRAVNLRRVSQIQPAGDRMTTRARSSTGQSNGLRMQFGAQNPRKLGFSYFQVVSDGSRWGTKRVSTGVSRPAWGPTASRRPGRRRVHARSSRTFEHDGEFDPFSAILIKRKHSPRRNGPRLHQVLRQLFSFVPLFTSPYSANVSLIAESSVSGKML
jgi:hypothetical protein